LPVDRHCGRRPVRAEGSETVAARTFFTCKDIRVGARISGGVARWSTRMSDPRPTNAGDERAGASSALDAPWYPNSDHRHYRARRFRNTRTLRIRRRYRVSLETRAGHIAVRRH